MQFKEEIITSRKDKNIMIEGNVYKKGNKTYICAKIIEFITCKYRQPRVLKNESKKESRDIMRMLGKGFNYNKRYILLRLNKSHKKLELELKNHDNLFRLNEISLHRHVSELRGIYIIKKRIKRKSIISLNEKEINGYENIGLKNNAKYKEVLDKEKGLIHKGIGLFIEENEKIEGNLIELIERGIEELKDVLICFCSNFDLELIVQKGLIAMSLKYGNDKAKEWFCKQLDEYKIKNLIESI